MPECLLLNIRPALKFHCLNTVFFQHFLLPFPCPACSHFSMPSLSSEQLLGIQQARPRSMPSLLSLERWVVPVHSHEWWDHMQVFLKMPHVAVCWVPGRDVPPVTSLSSVAVALVSPPGHFRIGSCFGAPRTLNRCPRGIVFGIISALFLLCFWPWPANGSFHQKGTGVGRKNDPRFHKSLICH